MHLDRSTNLQQQRELQRIQGLDDGKTVDQGSTHCIARLVFVPVHRSSISGERNLGVELVGIVWPDGDAADKSRTLGAASGGDGWDLMAVLAFSCVGFWQIDRDGESILTTT